VTTPNPPRPYIVTTAINGQPMTHHIDSAAPATAISSSLELHGPGAVLVTCLRDGEWK
jgi:hypothetical protein